MLTFYLQIKAVHVAAIMLSGALFALRGAGVVAGMRWPKSLPARWLSFAIDTTLLTAALMLLTALKLNPFVIPWLAVKLALLAAYIVLGALAMGRAAEPRVRAACFVAALACYGFVYTIARAHHPLGFLQGLAS